MQNCDCLKKDYQLLQKSATTYVKANKKHAVNKPHNPTGIQFGSHLFITEEIHKPLKYKTSLNISCQQKILKNN